MRVLTIETELRWAKLDGAASGIAPQSMGEAGCKRYGLVIL